VWPHVAASTAVQASSLATTVSCHIPRPQWMSSLFVLIFFPWGIDPLLSATNMLQPTLKKLDWCL
jgi:hypothetical protein